MPPYQQNNLSQQFSPEQPTTGWPVRLFVFSLALLAIALVIYAGLLFGYKPYLEKQIADTDDKINKLAQTISKENQEQLLRFYSQVLNLKNILDKHVIASKFLPFLQKVTNKKVFFTRMTATSQERTIALDGQTDSYETLAQQLQAFKESKEVERYIITDSQLNENRVAFKVQVVLMPSLFKL